MLWKQNNLSCVQLYTVFYSVLCITLYWSCLENKCFKTFWFFSCCWLYLQSIYFLLSKYWLESGLPTFKKRGRRLVARLATFHDLEAKFHPWVTNTNDSFLPCDFIFCHQTIKQRLVTMPCLHETRLGNHAILTWIRFKTVFNLILNIFFNFFDDKFYRKND